MNSSVLSMETLCILVKVMRMILNAMPGKGREMLRTTVGTLSSCLSCVYPMVVRDEGLEVPVMIVEELWEDKENYAGRESLIKTAKELIEELNPIKPEVLAGARANMKKAGHKEDAWIENKDLARLRAELHELLLRNKGYVPDETNCELFKKYNNIVARIKKLEEEKPTILSDIDIEYEKLIKEELT